MQTANVVMLKSSPFSEAVKSFLALELEGKTRIAYGEDLSLFMRFLGNKGLADIKVSDIGPSLVAEFRDEELNRTSVSSCLRRMSALSSFFVWAGREGITIVNPVKRIKLPRTQQPVIDILSKEEILRLLRMPDLGTWRGRRDRAILSIAYYTGVRISELIAIMDEDLIYEKSRKYEKTFKPCLHVVGKGGKARNIPLAEAVKGDVMDYLEARPLSIDGYLFVTEGGNQITEWVVRHALVKYSKTAGIVKNVTPHTLRHSFASHQLDNGVSIKEVQADLGHASLVTTEKYLHLAEEAERRGVDRLPSLPRAGARFIQ